MEMVFDKIGKLRIIITLRWLKVKFEKAYKEFLLYASKRHKKQGFVTLESNFNSRILPYFREYDIHNITSRDILKWQDYIYSLGFKYSYTSKLFIYLKCFMNFCCDFLGLAENPVNKVPNFKRDIIETKHDFYTLKEFNHFIKHVDNEVYKQFFNLMFFTGTRPGEAMALKFSDLDGNYLNINKNLTTKGGRNLDSPKNRSSIRLIKIDNKLKRDLYNLKEYYKKNYNADVNDYFIFGGIKPLSPTTINRYKKTACNNANIRPIKLHEFRHSHATLLLQNGMMINEVSRRLGHNKVSTTLNIYAHTDLLQEKRVYNTLNSMRFSFFDTLESNFKNIISLLKH